MPVNVLGEIPDNFFLRMLVFGARCTGVLGGCGQEESTLLAKSLDKSGKRTYFGKIEATLLPW